MLSDLFYRLRAISRRTIVEREMQDELKLHLELETQKLIRSGTDPDQAARVARLRLGGPAQIQEECRDARGVAFWDVTWRDLRYAARQLRNSPGFAASVVVLLALGIGVNTALFSIVKAVLLAPLPYPAANRIVAIWERNPQRNIYRELVTPGDYSDWKAATPGLQSIAFSPAWPGGRWVNVIRPDGVKHLAGAYVSASWFDVLGIKPLIGRTFNDKEDVRESTPTVVLSYELWQRWFGGDPAAIGKMITIDSYHRRQFTIIGVMPRAFAFPAKSELYLSAGTMGVDVPLAHAADRGGPWFEVIARIKPGFSPEQVQTEIDALAKRIEREHPTGAIGSTVSVLLLRDQLVGSVQSTLLALLGSVFLVLLIACANVASLLITRASARRQELVVRAALGATRVHLIRQLATETLVLSGISGVLGALGAWLGIAAIKLSPLADTMPRTVGAHVDLPVLLFATLLALFAGLLSGVLPSNEVVRPELYEALQEDGRTGTASRRLQRARQLLIVGQIATAVVLMIGSGLLLRSLLKLQSVDPGFQPEQVLAMGLDMSGNRYTNDASPARPQQFFERLIEQANAMPGVLAVGGVSVLPLEGGGWRDRPGGGWSNQGFKILGAETPAGNPMLTADPRVVTPGYFTALRIPLRLGRTLSKSDHERAPRVVLINEAMAQRYWPNHNPIGQHMNFDNHAGQPVWREVVGVVGDVRSAGLESAPRPEFYLPFQQSVWYDAQLVIRTTRDPSSIAGIVRERIKALDPEVSVTRVRTLNQMVTDTTMKPRLRTILISSFGLLALLLASVGLYGTLAYTVAERKREIGIRMALGARSSEVVISVVRRGLVLTGAGLALGSIVGISVMHAFDSFLFGISILEPTTLMVVVAVLLITAAFASFLPAQRASRIDPVIALRHS